MFSTDFIFRQPEMLGWIQAAMQQNTINLRGLKVQNQKWCYKMFIDKNWLFFHNVSVLTKKKKNPIFGPPESYYFQLLWNIFCLYR